MQIVYKQREYDWVAYLFQQSGTWECAKTKEEALGKLVISLLSAGYIIDVKQNLTISK